MKSLLSRAALAAALASPFGLWNIAFGQYGAPSLLPVAATHSSYGSNYYTAASSPEIGTPPGYATPESSILRSPSDVPTPTPVPAPYPEGTVVGDSATAGDAGCGYDVGYGYGAGLGGCRWFGSVGGLIMNRDDENHYYFSYYDSNESIQLLNSREAQMDWTGGAEVRVGRRLGCNSALEFVIWSLFPGSQSSELYAVAGDQLNAILNFDQLDISIGGVDTNVGTLVNDAQVHRIERDFAVNNLELNLWSYSLYGGGKCGSCGPTGCGCHGCGMNRLSFFAGVRYFRFRDNLSFSASTVGSTFTGAEEEITYMINLTNNLIGAQIGGSGEWSIAGGLSFVADMKLGLYGNHIRHHSCIGNQYGHAWINNGPNDGVVFDVENTKNDVSLLGEVDLGLRYRFGCRWSAALGYRALGVSGLALPTNQIYPDLRGIQDVQNVDSNGSLILHGGYARIEYCF